MLQTLWQILRAALRGLFGALLGLALVFEEWGWEPLQRGLAWLGRLPLLRQIEALVARAPPPLALLILLLPAVTLLPVKLGALWLIGQGHRLLGLGLIVLAKLVGTAVVARLFTLTQPALMRMPWFAHLHGRWVVWKDGLLAQVRASWPWRAGRVAKRRARQLVNRWRARWGL